MAHTQYKGHMRESPKLTQTQVRRMLQEGLGIGENTKDVEVGYSSLTNSYSINLKKLKTRLNVYGYHEYDSECIIKLKECLKKGEKNILFCYLPVAKSLEDENSEQVID